MKSWESYRPEKRACAASGETTGEGVKLVLALEKTTGKGGTSAASGETTGDGYGETTGDGSAPDNRDGFLEKDRARDRAERDRERETERARDREQRETERERAEREREEKKRGFDGGSGGKKKREIIKGFTDDLN
ncbi:hypothetical protein AAC387_Pa03g1172 [Persea americana]